MKFNRYKLKQLRVKHNLTQQQLGELLGYKNNSICQIENGKRNMSIEKMVELAELFDISIDELFK